MRTSTFSIVIRRTLAAALASFMIIGSVVGIQSSANAAAPPESSASIEIVADTAVTSPDAAGDAIELDNCSKSGCTSACSARYGSCDAASNPEACQRQFDRCVRNCGIDCSRP